MKPFGAIMFVSISGACAAWAQDNSGLHARELFYTPGPPTSQTPAQTQTTPGTPAKTPDKAASNKTTAKAPATAKTTPPATSAHQPVSTITVDALPAPLGIRYSVMKRNAAGNFDEVDPDTSFRSGDRIRVKVNSNNTGYLYIVAQGSSGAWQLLFPSAEVAGGSNLIQRGESRMVPSGDRGQWAFDDRGGVEKLFVVLTRQPEPDLDKLIYSFSGSQKDTGAPRTLLAKASVGDDVIARLRQQVAARDLVFEKVDSDTPGQIEKAAYVVNPSGAPDSRIVVDLALKHK